MNRRWVAIRKNKKGDDRGESRSTPQKRTGFWLGLTLGGSIVLFFYTFILYTYITVAGLRITVDQENLATLIRARVEAEVAKELPVLVGRIKYELPLEIEANLVEDFRDISIQIGATGSIDLPPEAAEVFREEFRVLTEEAILDTLDNIELTPYIKGLGEAAYYLTKKTLQDEVIGRTHRFQAHRWLSVPITIVAQE